MSMGSVGVFQTLKVMDANPPLREGQELPDLAPFQSGPVSQAGPFTFTSPPCPKP